MELSRGDYRKAHKISNLEKYNQALVNRGSVTFWIDDIAIKV